METSDNNYKQCCYQMVLKKIPSIFSHYNVKAMLPNTNLFTSLKSYFMLTILYNKFSLREFIPIVKELNVTMRPQNCTEDTVTEGMVKILHDIKGEVLVKNINEAKFNGPILKYNEGDYDALIYYYTTAKAAKIFLEKFSESAIQAETKNSLSIEDSYDYYEELGKAPPLINHEEV